MIYLPPKRRDHEMGSDLSDDLPPEHLDREMGSDLSDDLSAPGTSRS